MEITITVHTFIRAKHIYDIQTDGTGKYLATCQRCGDRVDFIMLQIMGWLVGHPRHCRKH
jgi:hypothetical protein